MATSPLPSRPRPSRGPERGRKGYVTPAFPGIPDKGEPHPCLFEGPKEGGNASSPLHSHGFPNKEEKGQKWLPHPYLLGAPKEGGNATSTLHSPGSSTLGAEQNQKWPPTKGTKAEVATPPPTFLGAPKRAEMLRQLCIVGDPQR